MASNVVILDDFRSTDNLQWFSTVLTWYWSSMNMLKMPQSRTGVTKLPIALWAYSHANLSFIVAQALV